MNESEILFSLHSSRMDLCVWSMNKALAHCWDVFNQSALLPSSLRQTVIVSIKSAFMMITWVAFHCIPLLIYNVQDNGSCSMVIHRGKFQTRMRLWRATVELCRLLLLGCDNTSFVHQPSAYFTRSVISQGSPPGKVVSGLCGLHRYWLLRGWRSRERAIIRNFALYLNEVWRCPGGWGKEDLKLSRWAGKYLSSICCWLWCFHFRGRDSMLLSA